MRRCTCLIPVLAFALTPVATAQDRFIRGDVDESGDLSLTDPLRILRSLFLGESTLVRCDDAADTDDDGSVQISDAILLLSHLFRGGPAPATPTGKCREDPTADDLSCERYGPCWRPVFVPAGEPWTSVSIVIDRSGAMQARGHFELAKAGALAVLSELPDGTSLGITAFDRGLIRFPASGRPLRLRPDTREAAMEWVRSVPSGSGSCVIEGLRQGIQFGNAGGAPTVVLYLTGGRNGCFGPPSEEYLESVVDAIDEANFRDHSIYPFLFEPDDVAREWYGRLAEANGGELIEIWP